MNLFYSIFMSFLFLINIFLLILYLLIIFYFFSKLEHNNKLEHFHVLFEKHFYTTYIQNNFGKKKKSFI